MTLTATRTPVPDRPRWTYRTTGLTPHGRYVAPCRNEGVTSGSGWALLLERDDGLWTVCEVGIGAAWKAIATDVIDTIDRENP